ncbi:MAG: hypothetical protein ACRD3G_08540 [Vicinamibacterales bacterium]
MARRDHQARSGARQKASYFGADATACTRNDCKFSCQHRGLSECGESIADGLDSIEAALRVIRLDACSCPYMIAARLSPARRNAALPGGSGSGGRLP